VAGLGADLGPTSVGGDETQVARLAPVTGRRQRVVRVYAFIAINAVAGELVDDVGERAAQSLTTMAPRSAATAKSTPVPTLNISAVRSRQADTPSVRIARAKNRVTLDPACR